MKKTPKIDFTHYYTIEAEGGRVGLAICKYCGATVILGDEFNAMIVHANFHKKQI